MKQELDEKIKHLICKTRVMTIAVSDKDVPWSSPVYFVFHNKTFYFFSNKKSRHIKFAKEQKNTSVSIFQDSDQIDLIFGLQMSGTIEEISNNKLCIKIVKKYVSKFSFLKKMFGSKIIENRHFFLEKFKSHLYCFKPDIIFLSDNSSPKDKRIKIDKNILLN